MVRPTEGAQVRRPGVVGHRGLEVRQVVELRGLPVTAPVSTLLDLAALPRTRVEDLVVATDAFVARDPRLLDEVVAAASERKPRRRGIRALRAALALVRVGSGSPMETKARLGFLRVGLPEPELNAELFHPDDGQFIARVDFLWRKARVVGEFEGDHHRTDRRQWQVDIARTRLLESLGWTVVRMTSADLATPQAWFQLTARLRALIAAAGNE